MGGRRNNVTFFLLSSLFVFLIYSELNSCDLYVFYKLPPCIEATCFLLAPCSNDVTMFICLSTVSGSCTLLNDCTCLNAILFKLPLRSFAFFAWWHWPTAPGDPPCQSSFYLCRYIHYLTGFFSFILKGSHHKEVWKMGSSAVREKQVLRARGQPMQLICTIRKTDRKKKIHRHDRSVETSYYWNGISLQYALICQ